MLAEVDVIVGKVVYRIHTGHHVHASTARRGPPLRTRAGGEGHGSGYATVVMDAKAEENPNSYE